MTPLYYATPATMLLLLGPDEFQYKFELTMPPRTPLLCHRKKNERKKLQNGILSRFQRFLFKKERIATEIKKACHLNKQKNENISIYTLQNMIF